MKSTKIDSIFFSDGYNLAKKHLENKINRENLIAMSGELYDSIDALMESFISRCRKEGKNVDCRKGCSICCCQAVLALPYEVLYVFNYLSKSLSDNDIKALSERAHHRDEVTKNMKVMEFLHYKSPCPLLVNDICIAYSARPMACRTYISSSREGCVKEYHNPSDHDIFPDLYEFTIRAGRMMNEGICAYLTEKRLLSTEWQIESMLITAFEKMDSFELWISGENVFQKRNYSDEEIYWINNFGKIKSGPGNS